MTTSFTAALTHLRDKATDDDLAGFTETALQRRKSLRTARAEQVTIGDAVTLGSLRDEYLNGLAGTVQSIDQQGRKKPTATVLLDAASTERLREWRQIPENTTEYPLPGLPMVCLIPADAGHSPQEAQADAADGPVSAQAVNDFLANTASTDQIEAALLLIRQRREVLAASRAAVIRRGMDVRINGMRPPYLNGLTGTVEHVEWAPQAVATILLDAPSTDAIRRHRPVSGAQHRLDGIPLVCCTAQ